MNIKRKIEKIVFDDGSFIKTHLFTLKGDSVGDIEIETPSNSVDTTIEAIIRSINIISEKFIPDKSLEKIFSVGIGVPGTIDSTNGKIIFAPNLKWSEIDFVDKLKKKINLSFSIENDANLAAIGEHWKGSASGIDNFISITVGTGIGGGIFVDGKLLTGVNHNSAEIGHMVINTGGLACNCGNYGCWEQYGSTSSLVRRVYNFIENDKNRSKIETYSKLINLIDNDLDKINGKLIVESAKMGDRLSQLEMDKMQYYLALGISNLIFIFNPQLILLNGGITRQGEWFISPIRKHVIKMVPKISLKNFEILAGKLGNMAGAYGAAFIGLGKDY